jgi:hypothetical protein
MDAEEREYEMIKEIRRLRQVVRQLEKRLDNGRKYLISVPDSDEFSFEVAFYNLGYTRDGLKELEEK